jgi:hypothetical protein
MTSHALRMDRVPFPVRVDRRRQSGPERPATQDPVEATSVWTLLGFAVLGWFGLMAVVTILAV